MEHALPDSARAAPLPAMDGWTPDRARMARELSEEKHPCLRMLREHALLDGSEIGSRARSLEIEWARPVDCATSLGQVPFHARALVEEALRRHPPRAKLCHDNAWKICAFSRGPFRMVSGYADAMIPMEHSWLRVEAEGFEPFDFDPTACAVFGGGHFSHHLAVVLLTPEQAVERGVVSRHSGPWRREMVLEALGLADPTRAPAPRQKKGRKP